MAVIEHRRQTGWEQCELEAGRLPIRIGAEATADLVLPAGPGVAGHHVSIVRSTAYSGFVLADLVGHGVRVNGAPVVRVKALRHLDSIQIGAEELRLRELSLHRVTETSPHLGKECLGRHVVAAGDEVVVCRCGTATHRDCWLMLDYCGQPACVYAVRNLLVRALSSGIRFMQVPRGSPLVNQSFCPSRRSRDSQPFQVGDQIAHCPRCQIPFHEKCWLTLERCPTDGCAFPVRELVDRVVNPP